MADCIERNRISREIAVAIRDIYRLKRERSHTSQDPTRIDTFFVLSRKLARLRADYGEHVRRHSCLETAEPASESTTRAYEPKG